MLNDRYSILGFVQLRPSMAVFLDGQWVGLKYLWYSDNSQSFALGKGQGQLLPFGASDEASGFEGENF